MIAIGSQCFDPSDQHSWAPPWRSASSFHGPDSDHRLGYLRMRLDSPVLLIILGTSETFSITKNSNIPASDESNLNIFI